MRFTTVLGGKSHNCKIKKREFSIKVAVEGKDFAGKWWLIFVYLSPDDLKRRR